MNIATLADVPRIVEMGARFHAQANLPSQYDRDAVAVFVSGLVAGQGSVVIASDSGMICGLLAPHYCDPDWVMAVELAWWATSGGLALLSAFEEWARERGAKEIRMTTLCALDRAEKIITRKGYAPTEISYSKVI